MKKILFLTLLFLNYGFVISQNIDLTKKDTIPAKFNGSSDLNKLRIFIQNQLIYPTTSAEKCEQGTVLLKFKITSNGKIDSIDLINELSPALNNEAIRGLMKSEPFWIPGIINSNNVSSTFIMPLIFVVDNSCKDIDYYIKKGNKFFNKLNYQNASINFAEVIKLNPHNFEILQKKIECDKNLNKTEILTKDMKLLDYISKIKK